MLNDPSLEELHVESVGDGPPLVLLHGWALHGGLFATLLPALAAKHRVHVVDLPGHGRSAPPAGWTLDGLVDTLDRGIAGRSLAVLGWSLGGTLALRWARRRPDRIARLVLVATTPKFVAGVDWPHAMSASTLARFADELRVAYRQTLARFLSLQVQGGDAARETLVVLRRHLFERGEPDPAVLRDALDMLRAADVRGDVPAIGAPALVVAGGRDTLAPAGAGAWLAAALPAGRLVAMPEAAHAPFLSHPRPFLEDVLAFLRDG